MVQQRTIGICGAGQIGAAAAVAFSRAGYRVLLWLRSTSKITATEGTLSNLEVWMNEHVGPPNSRDGSVEVIDSLNRIDNECELVMEAIAENLAQKVELFSRLADARCRGAIFLTTTSGLSITDLGRESLVGKRLVGTHFWNPPHLMPLVEVVRGEDTQEDAVVSVVEIVQSIGKIPVIVNHDVPGFVGNRLLHALWREAISLVELGIASPADVDLVARLTFGLRLAAVGPLENMDVVGLDLIATIHEYLLADLCDADKPQPALIERVTKGHLGVKSGAGFYDWTTRNARDLIERRDRQIVNQLAFLREIDAV